jgi:hypothetical protein
MGESLEMGVLNVCVHELGVMDVKEASVLGVLDLVVHDVGSLDVERPDMVIS